VVYRVHEDKIVVAVDELTESATLDVPLRLDKLANKVRGPHTIVSSPTLLGIYICSSGSGDRCVEWRNR
jgi:phage FluMu protein gp41